MFKELGGLLGWLLIITIAGTILNYCLKLVNRHFGKKISASPIGKRTLKVLMSYINHLVNTINGNRAHKMFEIFYYYKRAFIYLA